MPGGRGVCQLSGRQSRKPRKAKEMVVSETIKLLRNQLVQGEGGLFVLAPEEFGLLPDAPSQLLWRAGDAFAGECNILPMLTADAASRLLVDSLMAAEPEYVRLSVESNIKMALMTLKESGYVVTLDSLFAEMAHNASAIFAHIVPGEPFYETLKFLTRRVAEVGVWLQNSTDTHPDFSKICYVIPYSAYSVALVRAIHESGIPVYVAGYQHVLDPRRNTGQGALPWQPLSMRQRLNRHLQAQAFLAQESKE